MLVLGTRRVHPQFGDRRSLLSKRLIEILD